MIKHPSQRVAVLIDTQNLYYSARNLFNAKVNFKNIVDDAVSGRQLTRAVAYVVKTKTGEERPFFEALSKAGIETKEKELQIFFGGAKKADWDVGLTVDAIMFSDKVDGIVLVSGDGDFLPLIQYLKIKGVYVEIMAFKETSSAKIVEAADMFVDLSADKGRYLMSGKDSSSQKIRNDQKIAKNDGRMQNKPANGRRIRPRIPLSSIK